MGRLILRLLFVVSFVGGTNIKAADDGRADREVIETLLVPMKCLGAVVAILPPGGEPVIEAYGVANLESGEPMTIHHHFRIGSVSKLFAGYVALKLVEKGEISFAQPIGRFYKGVPSGDEITLQQLGTHTSGIGEPMRNAKFREEIAEFPGKNWAPPEILRRAFSVTSGVKPRGDFSYSNANTILLGEALTTASGESWAALLKREIFTPMGLRDTALDEPGRRPEKMATGYRHGSRANPVEYGETFYEMSEFNSTFFGCAGNLISTASDLAKAARPLLAKLEKASGSRWHATSSGEYGFCVERWDGLVGHRGDVPGFQSVVAVDPDSGFGYVVLCNLSNTKAGKMPANEILRMIRKSSPSLSVPN